MGCFQSAPVDQPSYAIDTAPPSAAAPVSVANEAKDVVSVARATITVDERDKAELKMKNLRDRMEQTIAKTEAVMRDEGKLALKLKAEGKKSSALALAKRRKYRRERLTIAEAQLDTVSDLLHGLESARDNKQLLDALNEGTKTLNDINKELSPEAIQDALSGHRDAVGYVNEVSATIAADRRVTDDEHGEDYESLMSELTAEFGREEAEKKSGADPTAAIPNVPDVQPSSPPSAQENMSAQKSKADAPMPLVAA